MRAFFIIILISTIWGCQQVPKKENQNPEQLKRYFFWSVDWHSDGEKFVVGGMQDTLRLFSYNDLKLLKNYPYKGTITKTKWHPTNNTLAVSVQDNVSYSTILDLDNNQSIRLDSISDEGARGLGWNHTGEMLAVGDNQGYVSFFNQKGDFIKKIDTNQKGLMGLDWHPKENTLVTVGERITWYNYDSDSMMHINDREDSIEVLMLCVAWHPSGDFFVTGDYGIVDYDYPALLQYWAYSGEKIKSIEASKAEYRNLKWSSDGSLLATASEKIRLWDENGDLVAEAANENLLWGIDWNKDDSQLVATDRKGRIIFWDKKLNRLRELQYW